MKASISPAPRQGTAPAEERRHDDPIAHRSDLDAWTLERHIPRRGAIVGVGVERDVGADTTSHVMREPLRREVGPPVRFDDEVLPDQLTLDVVRP